MNYTVTKNDEMIETGLSETRATGLAKRIAADTVTGDQVYVSWYRPGDGQHGYLNPGGDHAITGRSWALSRKKPSG